MQQVNSIAMLIMISYLHLDLCECNAASLNIDQKPEKVGSPWSIDDCFKLYAGTSSGERRKAAVGDGTNYTMYNKNKHFSKGPIVLQTALNMKFA